jgi:hypothetical protein
MFVTSARCSCLNVLRLCNRTCLLSRQSKKVAPPAATDKYAKDDHLLGASIASGARIPITITTAITRKKIRKATNTTQPTQNIARSVVRERDSSARNHVSIASAILSLGIATTLMLRDLCSLTPNASLSGVAKRRALCSSLPAQCVTFRHVRCSELLACRFQTPRHQSPHSLSFSGLYPNHGSSTKRPFYRASEADSATLGTTPAAPARPP